jgi:chromosome segregation ATPase
MTKDDRARNGLKPHTAVSHAKADPIAADDQLAPGPGADRVRLESALLEAQEEIHEHRLAMEVMRKELGRTREDLTAAHQRLKEDAERFRDGLAQVRASADQALADEQSATQEMASRLGAAEDAVARLREELESATSSLARVNAEAEDMRLELSRVREESENATGALAIHRTVVEEARSDGERLLARLIALEESLNDRERTDADSRQAPPAAE